MVAQAGSVDWATPDPRFLGNEWVGWSSVSAWQKALALARIAQALSSFGEADQARRVWTDATAIARLGEASASRQDSVDSSSVLWEIAEGLAGAGELAAATAVARAIRTEGLRARALSGVETLRLDKLRMVEERAYSNGFIAPSSDEASLTTPTGSEALLIEIRRDAREGMMVYTEVKEQPVVARSILSLVLNLPGCESLTIDHHVRVTLRGSILGAVLQEKFTRSRDNPETVETTLSILLEGRRFDSY